MCQIPIEEQQIQVEIALCFQPASAAGGAVPLDTPAVVAARAHHFHAKAAQYALVGPGPYYGYGGYGYH